MTTFSPNPAREWPVFDFLPNGLVVAPLQDTPSHSDYSSGIDAELEEVDVDEEEGGDNA